MKKHFRKKFLEKRDKLSLEYRKKAEKTIFSKLESMEYFKNAKKIFMYVGFGSEINTLKFLEKYYLEKEIYIPKIVEKEMYLTLVKKIENLQPNLLGILELNTNIYYTGNIDLVITPAIVFSKDGYRLGYGGGYYDRYFSQNNYKLAVGLILDKMLEKEIPIENRDKKVDIILTEERLLKFDRK